MDSDDDLDGFLAGLRQRYNLGDEPTPAPSTQLALSTDANIFGQDTPVFGTRANRPVAGSQARLPADYQQTTTEGTSVHQRQPASSGQGDDTHTAAAPVKQGDQHSSDVQNAAQRFLARTEQLQQQNAGDPPAAVSPAASESASCATPGPQHTTEPQQAPAEPETAAAAYNTPSGMLTIDGEGIAAAATPHTTAAMPAARTSPQQQADAAAVGQPAAGPAAELSVRLAAATVGPAESVEAQAAVGAADSDDPDSPGSVKKPLYSVFLAAATAAEGKTYTAPQAAAEGAMPGHDDGATGSQRSSSNVPGVGDVAAQQLGHVEQQQQAVDVQLLQPTSGSWTRDIYPDMRGMLMHKIGLQQQQSHSEVFQEDHGVGHLHREITLSQSDLQQHHQQQQQEGHPKERSSPLQPSRSSHTEQQQQQQQRSMHSATLTAKLAAISTAAADARITSSSSTDFEVLTGAELDTGSSRRAAAPSADSKQSSLSGTLTQQLLNTQVAAAGDNATSEVETVHQLPAQDVAEQVETTAAAAAVDWTQLSSQLSMAGFGPLSLKPQADGTGPASSQSLPELHYLHETLSKVLREYQRRDSLISQLLSERDDLRRGTGRSLTEHSRLERQRDDALRAADRAKAELADIRQREIPVIEAKHKDALNKLNSEVAKLKHALKEAEQTAAVAQAAAAGGELVTLQQQLQNVTKEKERLSIESERLSSELTRQKPYIGELERAAAAARAAARQSDDTAGLLERQLRELKQQQQDEVAALTAELTKARHTIREAEQQLAAFHAETASGGDAAQVLLKQITAERSQHDEQQAHLSSELQKLRQQLLQLQSAANKADSAAKADSDAAVFSSKQLVVQERQHAAEVAKLQAELKQAREQGQLMQAKATAAEAAAAEQLSAATAAAAAALQESEAAAVLQQELDKQRSSSKQQLQHLGQQLLEARRSSADAEQQLASTQAELRRLRAAAALVDTTGAAAGGGYNAAGAGGDDPAAAGVRGFSVTPARSARVAVPQSTAAAAAAVDGDTAHPISAWDTENGDSMPGSTAEKPGAAAAAGAGSDVDLAAALGRAVRAEAALADVEQQLISLRYQALQLETAGNRKEKEIEALRERLADKVVKEERRLARDKQAYARIRQAHAQSRRPTATTPAGLGLAALGGSDVTARRAAAGAVAAAARELRPVELVGIYESQKEVMEKELAAAKAEVRVLSGQLRDASNLMISKDRAAAVAAAAAGLKGSAITGLGDPAAAVAAQRKAAELQRELCSVRADAAAALREAAKRLAESEAVVKRLREDNEGLQAELQGRPTLNEFKQQRREIDLLQRKIGTLRRQAATAAAGGAAAAGEDGLERAGDAWPPGEGGDGSAALGFRGVGSRSTRAAIERDKAIARLRLGVVEEYPRDVLVDLIQDVCLVLELRDATMLVPNLRKMTAVVTAIPKLEAFVAQVCECCFRQGVMFVPTALQQQMNPGAVPQVLQHWLQLLQQGEQLRLLTQRLQHLLAQRSSSTAAEQDASLALSSNPIGATGEAMSLPQLQQLRQQVLQHVEQLLHIESAAVAASDVLSAAEGLMADKPEGLLQQLLAQVQYLFDIPSLEGVPAAMNKVYVHYSELCNFFKALSSLLALPSDAGPAAAVAAVSSVIQQAARPPSKVRAAAAELQKAAGLTEQAAEQSAAGETEAEQQRDAAAAALQALLAAVGAGDVQEAVTKHQDMKHRLERLDKVLPRYQRLAAELYDRLRVVSLDEVLPALDRVLAAAPAVAGGSQQ